MQRLAQYPRVVHATARDPQSCASLLDLGREATICRDPGLLAASAWPPPARRPRARPLIGVGLTHPVLLAHHTSCRASPSYEGAVSLYTEMIGSICAQDCDVVCFTNGAGEDERLLDDMRQQRNLAGLPQGRLSFAARCRSPGELARLIGRLDAVVAHRLHASVLAYAYRLPSVGLLWDDKLRAFYQSVGRSKYLVPFDHANAVRIGSLVNEAIAEGIDVPAHARVLQETRQAIDDLVRAIAARTGAPVGDGRISPPCTSGSRPQVLPASPSRWMGAA
jgi:polysaccharide pyruvyl transferase WcaK-like protein